MFCCQIHLAHSSLFTNGYRRTFTISICLTWGSPSYITFILFYISAQRLFPFLWFVSYIYNKVEWQQRLIT